jgi:hypothetical protein
MTAHPGYVSRDHSEDYPTYIATCPRCDWEARPTVLMGLAHQWLRDHQDQQRQQQQQQGESG